MESLLNHLRRCVRRLLIIQVLDGVVDKFKVLINCQVHVNELVNVLIVGFEVHGCDLPVAIEQMLEDNTAREPKEGIVLILNYFRYVTLPELVN